jgi:ATP-dependent Lhr-like helicase
MKAERTKGYKAIQHWLLSKNWKLADFQEESIRAYLQGKNGLINAPTGTGKTFSLYLPALIQYLNSEETKKNIGLQVLWITPLRALTKDLQRNMQMACAELNIPWQVSFRTGDTTAKEKEKQKKQMPETLLITPESLHILFTQKEHAKHFRNLKLVVVDEWHELLGTKRGVQVELALSHLRALKPDVLTWGMSATIGNIDQALEALVGKSSKKENAVIITSKIKKKVVVESVLPDKIESLPWAGYLGINLIDKVMPLVFQSKTTLLFTNTRSQTEIWYRFVIEKYPELTGLVALHHGSLDPQLRAWVEENLHAEKLRLVICTSSLDLGVDFRPVDTVIQVGSPKSIARFLQRAGRSGHRPDAISKIYFVPTHAVELIEAVSLREGIVQNILEDRVPIVQAFDVLAQYMVTLALGDGFEEEQLFQEVRSTFAYQYLNREEWEYLLGFITTGGPSLTAYDEFEKVKREGKLFVVKNRYVAMRHRLNMGTIVSDSAMQIKTVGGKYLGSVEETFISRLKPGNVFSFAGMNLEFIRVKDMTAQVKKAESNKGAIPSWAGGRIPLSSKLTAFIRERLDDALNNKKNDPEINKLSPLLQLQAERSAIPHINQLLIEQCETKEGFHIFIFPFEGRLVHEGIASLIAYRISKIIPVTFSMAMNDYGFELLSGKPIDIGSLLEEYDLFTTEYLLDDIQQSVNSNEMAKRKFREIAAIAGLIFQGYPGKAVKTRHLQASSSLLFEVIREHEPKSLLIRQAYQEALDQQLEEQRLRNCLKRLSGLEILLKQTERPSPLAFPILVDRFREQLTSEKMEDRINRLLGEYKKSGDAEGQKTKSERKPKRRNAK